MSSFMSQILQPGGGVLLLPFVRGVVGLLLLTTITIFALGVARIHMAILSFLSTGLLFSLHMFEQEYNKAKSRYAEETEDEDTDAAPVSSTASDKKTD